MQREARPTTFARMQRRHTFSSNYVQSSIADALMVVLGALLSLFVSVSVSAKQLSLQRALVFIVGLVLLSLVVIGIATLIRRRNRDVIFLKQRLSEVYLSALRKSALNPKLETPTLNA